MTVNLVKINVIPGCSTYYKHRIEFTLKRVN